MQEFQSDILRQATIEYEFNIIKKIIVNSGEYTEEQKMSFVGELKAVLFEQYAELESLDLSNIDLDEKYLREIFRMAGTANIQVNPKSSFYEFLQKASELSGTCLRRMGIKEDANNLETYKVLVEQKKSSFHFAIIPAKDLCKLSDYMDIKVAQLYNIAINDLEDIKAFREIKDSIKYSNAKIFVREGLSLADVDTGDFQVIADVRQGKVSLSREEELFNSDNTANQAYRKNKPKKELDTEELILCAMNNRCIPARALALIGDEILNGLTKITLSVETEEDRNILEEYKKQQGLQAKKVFLVVSTAQKMPLDILEGLDIERVMVGTDENENGKYRLEDYQKIYSELESLTKDIDTDSSDYDKFQIIYERLSKRLKYDYKAWKGSKDYDPEYARQAGVNATIDLGVGREVSRLANLEAFLYDGKSICQGFSEILRQTLSMIGIEAHNIVGKDGGERHAWNRVKLDGKLYNCDLTGDKDLVNNYGIYKKARPRRVLKNNPSLSKKIMPHYYLKSDKTFSKDHIPDIKPEEEALEDFDADSYYQKDFRSFLKNIFQSISTRFCRTVETVMWGDIGEWERRKGIKEEKTEDDRSL